MKTRVFWLVIVTMSACLCQVSWAQEDGKFLIDGRVVDFTARPVEGAEVAVYEKEYQDNHQISKMIAPIVKTDRDGQFQLRAEVTSQYDVFIVARKPGLAMAWDGLNYSRNTLGKGHFLLVLERPCTMTGTVVDAKGQPVPGATVQAIPKTSYMDRLSQRPMLAPQEWFTVKTDREGVFRLEAFTADVTSDFWVKAPSLVCTYKFTTHSQDGCGYEVDREGIELVLPEESCLKGRVVDAVSGQPISQVKLCIQADRERGDIRNCYIPQYVNSDASGQFFCPGLPTGKNKITPADSKNGSSRWVTSPVSVDIIPGQPVEDVEVSVQEGSVIECTARDRHTETPIPEARASVYCQATKMRYWGKADEEGVARVYVLPGEYQVSLWKRGYASWSVNEPMILEAGQTKMVEGLLDRDPSLDGTVVGSNGQPVEDVLVGMHPFGDRAYTDSKGHFKAGYDQRRSDDGIVVIARERKGGLVGVVDVNNFNEPISVSLEPGLVAKGRIIDPNGTGVPAARIVMCVLLSNCLCPLGEEVLTDSKGCFELRAMPVRDEPFDFRISVFATDYAPKSYDRIAIKGQAGETVDLEPIEMVAANLSVSGTVVDANGVLAPRTILFLQGQAGMDQPDKATATDSQGRFAFTRIGKGPIRLQAGFSSDPNGSGYLKAQAGDHEVKIVLGQTLVHERYESLLDKALPDLSGLGVDSDKVETENKAILLCFFDMQQRPSRHVVAQLSKKAEMLGSKGIVTVIVDVSGAGEDEFDRWVTKQKITYWTGAIRENWSEKRLKWGVRALPWLVLTNPDHQVSAEGFDLNQLDEKI